MWKPRPDRIIAILMMSIAPLSIYSNMFVGLSKEGWHITKNLMIELAIVFVGFLTFEPAIQVRVL